MLLGMLLGLLAMLGMLLGLLLGLLGTAGDIEEKWQIEKFLELLNK